MWQMVRMLVGTSLAFDWAWGTNQPTSCPLAMESKKTPKAGEANGLIIIPPAVGVRELVMFLAEYLLANYPSQTRVAQLLNTTDVWLMPRYFSLSLPS